jgi:hypothetical protein
MQISIRLKGISEVLGYFYTHRRLLNYTKLLNRRRKLAYVTVGSM